MPNRMRSSKRNVVRSRRPSNVSGSRDATSDTSDTEAENSELKSLKSRAKLANKSTFSFLDDLRQGSQSTGTSRLTIPIELQLALTSLIHIIVGYAVLEPILPPEWVILPLDNDDLLDKSTTSSRLAFIFQNSCFSLVWVLFSELYKVYLRTMSDIHSANQAEMSLCEQIRINNRVKMAERVHIRSLSQFVLVLICQLNFAFYQRLIPLLYRAVPALTFFYMLSRISDALQPKRLRIFSHAIIYVPMLLCFGYFFKCQIVKLATLIANEISTLL